MLRQSAAPMALCVFLLASCNSAEEASVTPAPISDDVPDPSGDGTSPDLGNLAVSMTELSAKQSSGRASNSDHLTLAQVTENHPWAVTIVAKDPSGETVALSVRDDGNGDAAAFDFNEQTGEFSLRKPQDFERPGDANANNRFELIMAAPEYPDFPGIPFTIDIADQKEIFEEFPVVWLEGETQFGGLGRNITPLGDVDNDGRPDLAIAAPGRHARDEYADFPPSGYHPAGEAYIVSGKILSEHTLLDFKDDQAAGVWHLVGDVEDLNLGYNMTLVGDLNDDDLDDFVVARNEQTLEVISGAVLLDRMTTGGDSGFDDLTTGTITLPDDQSIDPRTFAAIGDLNDDGLTDLAMCAHEHEGGSQVEAQVFTVSGAALKDVMLTNGTRQIEDLYAEKEAAYYAYSGNHATCGPLSSLGDVNNDGLEDVAIPMPGPQIDDSGILVFGGTELLEMMQEGGRHSLTNIDKFFGRTGPYTHFSDEDATGTEQDYMVTRLGDVTGDGVDDFGFSWVRYLRANDSAYVIKGNDSLLSASGSSKDIREMVARGEAIQMAATPDGLPEGAPRVEPIHAMIAPQDGLHATLVFVGAGETSGFMFENFSIAADELPDAGTLIAPLPISAAGTFIIPKANGRLLSQVTSVGDLNNDGYGDLAVGWGTAGSGRSEDQGAVLLVSGREVVEARNRGETLDPTSMLAPQD